MTGAATLRPVQGDPERSRGATIQPPGGGKHVTLADTAAVRRGLPSPINAPVQAAPVETLSEATIQVSPGGAGSKSPPLMPMAASDCNDRRVKALSLGGFGLRSHLSPGRRLAPSGCRPGVRPSPIGTGNGGRVAMEAARPPRVRESR